MSRRRPPAPTEPIDPTKPTAPWVELRIPRDNTSAPLTASQLYSAFHAVLLDGGSMQLLLCGTDGAVGLWLRAHVRDLVPLTTMVRATYPDLEIHDGTPPVPDPGLRGALSGAEWGLVASCAFPIKTVRDFIDSDPMAMLVGALSDARSGECGALSLALTPAPSAYARRAAKAVAALAEGRSPGGGTLARTGDLVEALATGAASALTGVMDAVLGGQPTAPGAAVMTRRTPELVALSAAITDKAAQPAFRVTLSTGWSAAQRDRASAGHRGLIAALGQFTVVGRNGLQPTRLAPDRAWARIAEGTPARRERMILTGDELAALLHSPATGTVAAGLPRTGARRRPTTARLPADGLHLADAADPGTPVSVGATVSSLMSHAYVLGPSGTGKTTMLTRLVVALADTDAGAIVLDPHGDLVRQVLTSMPAEHCDRLVLFDLADPANLPGLNPLWLPPADPQRHQVNKARRSAAVTALFTDLWGLHRAATPNLLHFLEAALAALIAADGHTLADLPRFLTDPAYRTQVVAAGNDPAVRERWTEFAALNHEDRSRTVRAILNKAVDFSRNPILATVFGDPGPGLRLDEVMDSGRILLVSLPRGLVPEGTVELIGSVLVSLAYQAALAREDRPAAQRAPVVAVIDEFQEFALSTFGKLVTATRKYGLGLVVANQNLSRIQSLSPDLLSTLLANVSTLVTFRTAPGDARVLAPYMSPFDAEDLSSLAGHDCYWRSTGLTGPQVIAAHSRPPLPMLRDDVAVAALAARHRLPGRPLRMPHAAPTPAQDWPIAVDSTR